MEQTIELRIVDPKTLIYADKRDPRQVPADRLSDAALRANSNAIGFVQPPLFSEEGDRTLTIIAGRRRIKSAIANKLKEMAILVKPADPLDDMRAVAENVVRAPISPIDLWRSIEDLASKNWTEEAIATAFAVPLRQVRKLRLLGSIHPAMLEHMGRGDMPEERYLRTIAAAPLSEQAAVWTKQKPNKGQTASWHAIANSLAKRQMFACDAKFGEKEQAAFGIVWTEDLFAPADEDSRYTIDVDAFVGAQLAWLEANVPKNGEIVQVDDYGAAKLPKGATRVWGDKPGKKDRVALSVDPRNGAVSEVYFTPPAPAAKASKTSASDDAPAAEPRTRPDITQNGREMIGEMRTEALVKALGREGLTSEALIGLLLLALAADNVSIRTHEYTPIRSIVSVIAEGGKLTSDTALIQTTAIKVLQTVLNCRLAYGVGSGLAARIAGEAIGADADMPHMGTEEFLACLSRGALEAEAGRHRVLPRGRVKDTRAALVEQVREIRLVLPAAQFALTEQESSDFDKKGSRCAHRDDSDEDPAGENEASDDGGEAADPVIAPDDADDDQEEEDETADCFARAEDANLEGDGGNLDDISPPIDAVDRAEAAYVARS
ncbi:ParB N-terminal domain-containing protein [Roseiarcus sp.]|jgi:ParB family chromosome partitioning protein|uniref:ParB N-terminal domain-containing protein n=1 Tax=Roseiarcus sp. TaxID=1969460 RepID=UPI003D0ED7E1